MILGYLGYKVRHVEPAQYRIPVGILAGLDAEEVNMQDTEPVDAEDKDNFADEMLILCTDNQQMFHQALNMMRKEKAVVDLKAMLTETNRTWNSVQLYKEIYSEHQYMKGMKHN
jgi:mRNA degradation ribonuclease J1/J2